MACEIISGSYVTRPIMSQMPPFLRGYRQALRDVQRAVLVYHQTMSGHSSAKAAVSAAADGISVPLRRIREAGITSLDNEVREQMAEGSTPQMEFAQGYEAGFEEAVSIVADWGRKMNDPAARDAIARVVQHLQQVRLQVTSESPKAVIGPAVIIDDP
jgi:hypothetical protein